MAWARERTYYGYVTPTIQSDVYCPRCHYNLRGQTVPRCSECGFEFDFAQLGTGMLRENIPTWLDRCDPWQPHQVLLGSMYELARGALWPRHLLSKLDVDGPLVPAGLMLMVGTIGLWLLTSATAAVAIILHAGISPAAAAKAALLLWGPRLLLLGYVGSIGLLPLATLPACLRVAHPTIRQQARFAAYFLPAVSAYCCVPTAIGLCCLPQLVLSLPIGLFLLTPLIWMVVAGLWELPRDGLLPKRIVISGIIFAFSVLALWRFRSWLLPDSLDLPWWIYSL